MDLIGLVAGAGWASGVNLYAAVALLGLYGRMGIGDSPESLQRLDVIIIASILFLVEFIADKVPWFDSFWDAVHTFIRPLGAAALGLLISGDAETWQQAVAAVGSGSIATLSHAAKTSIRLAINTSPEPASNSGMSLFEDGLVAAVIWFAVANPLLALILVTVLLIAGTTAMVFTFRVARRAWRKRRERRQLRKAPPPGGDPLGSQNTPGTGSG